MASPNGIDLASGTTNGNTLPEFPAYEDRTITLDSSAGLITGLQYSVVVRAPDAPINNDVFWHRKAAGTKTGGSHMTSVNSGVTWSDLDPADAWFQTFTDSTYRDQYAPTTDGVSGTIIGVAWKAQTYTAFGTYSINKVKLRLSREVGASPGTITVGIQATAPVEINDLFLGTEGTAIVAAVSAGVSVSTDFGSNWTNYTPDGSGSTVWSRVICSGDGTYIYAWDENDTIYRTADGGTNWAAITPAGGDTFAPNDIAISSSGAFVIIVGTNSTTTTESAYYSSDYGVTWTAVNPVSEVIAWDECAIDDTGYVVSVAKNGTDYFYATFDGGTIWHKQYVPATSDYRSALSISGDGKLGLVANVSDNNEVFMNTGHHIEVIVTDSPLTLAGRNILDDATPAAQVTTLGFTETAEDISNHIFGTGADHTYIDQDVTTTGTPTFKKVTITRTDVQPQLLVRAPTDTGNGSQAQIELNAGVSSTTRWLMWASASQDNLVFYDAIDARSALVIDTSGVTTLTGLDLSGITDGNIPYISTSGFADSLLSYDVANSRLEIGTVTDANVDIGSVLALYDSTGFTKISLLCDADKTATLNFSKGSGADAYIAYYQYDASLGRTLLRNAGTDMLYLTGALMGIREAAPETLLEMTSVAPYLTIHNSTEENIDGGGEGRIIFKREDGAGTETQSGMIEVSHNGAGVNDQLTKMALSVNTGSGLAQRLTMLSSNFNGINQDTPTQVWEVLDTDRADMVIHTKNDTVGKMASLSFGVTTGGGAVIQNGSRSCDIVATRGTSNVFSLGLYASDGTTNNLVLTLNGNKQATFGGDILFSSGAGLLFGEIYGYDKATEIVVSGAGIANKVQITCFDTNGQSNGTTPDHTNDHITVLTSGIYKITVSLSCKSTAAGDADNIGFAVYKNNGATLLHQTKRQLAGGGVDIGAVPISGLASLTANDTIEVWLWNIDDTDNVVIDDINLSVVLIGG